MKLLLPQQNMNHNGFTLMEVMVSVSIFAIIITIGIGSLLTIYSTLQKTRADQQTMDSLSYVMDTMTRRVRTGTSYSSDGQSITFKDQVDQGVGGNMITYGMRPDPDTGEQRLYVSEADGEYDITPENMRIDAFAVNLTGGAAGTDGGQPLVEFQIQATIKNGKQETPLAIQTAVSQRPFEGGGTIPTNVKTGTPDGGSFAGSRELIGGRKTEGIPSDKVNTDTTNSADTNSVDTRTLRALNNSRQ